MRIVVFKLTKASHLQMTRLAEACYSQTTNSSTNPNTAIYQTCGQTRIFQHNPVNNYKQTIHSMIALIFDEDVIFLKSYPTKSFKSSYS